MFVWKKLSHNKNMFLLLYDFTYVKSQKGKLSKANQWWLGLPGTVYELNFGVYTHTMHIYVNMYICRYMYIYICVYIYKGTCIYTYKGLTYFYVCVCSTCVQLPTEVREGIRYPRPRVTGVVNHLLWLLGANSNSLEEQQALSVTEPSLLPRFICSFWRNCLHLSIYVLCVYVSVCMRSRAHTCVVRAHRFISPCCSECVMITESSPWDSSHQGYSWRHRLDVTPP